MVGRRFSQRASATGLVVIAGALLLQACGKPASSATPAGRSSRPAAVRSATVWAVGDGADGSPRSRAVARRVAAGHPFRFLYLGDVYPSGSPSGFRHGYAPVYGALRKITLPTPGNHDWPLHGKGYDRYWAPAPGRRPPDFYALRLAGWKIISLNSERSLARNSSQQRWLRRQLAGPGTCRLAFWHRPRFSAGSHGDQPDVEPLWKAVRGRVALVLNGHDHNMQQLRAIGGTTELVVGSGGHGSYPLDSGYGRLVWANASVHGALRLRLRSGRAEFSFVAADGRVLRRGAVGCRPGR